MSTLQIELPDELVDKIVEEALRRMPAPSSTEKTWLTAREAAEYLRLSRSQMYKLARLGEIPSHQPMPDGKLLFARSDLDAWVTKRRKESS